MKKKIKLVINKASSFVAPLFNQPKKYIKTWLVIFLALTAGLVAFFFLLSPRATEAAWWDETWLYRRAIQISNDNGEDLEDFQVAITLDTAALITAGKMQADCDDLRITDQNGQILPHWIEENNPGCNNAATKVWVKIPIVHKGANATTVYAYYGNSQAENAENGDNVFEFFEDMENWDGWTTHSSGQVSQSGSRVFSGSYSAHKTTNNDPHGAYKDIDQTMGRDIVLEFFVNRNSGYSGGDMDRIGLIDNNGNGYGWAYNHGTNVIGKDIRTNYSGSYTSNSADSGYMDSWVKAQFIIASDNSIIARRYTDGTLIGEHTSSDSGYSSFTRFYIFGGHDYWVDQVTIRKYAATDPTAGSPAAEETSTKGGPVAYWKFDEGTGTTANDSSGQGYHGAITEATWQSEEMCVAGKCLYFDGSDDYVSVSNAVSGIKTVSFWVKPNTTTEYFVDLNGSAYISATSGTISATGFTNPSIYVNGQASTTIIANSWQYITVTTNTALAGSAVNLGKISTNYLQGFLDEVKIYNYARSAKEIKADYAAGLAGIGSAKGSSAIIGSSGLQSALSDGLVGYWKMDEASWNGTAGEVKDASGNGNHGVAVNGATTGAGKYGNGGVFDGNDDYASLGTPTSLGLTNDFSLSLWVNQDSDASGNNVLYSAGRTGGQYWYLQLTSSSAPQFFLDDVGGYTANNTISKGSWQHILITKNSNRLIFYINGVESGTSTVTQTVYANGEKSIARRLESSGQLFKGKLDEVRIYNRSLSPAEVKALYEWAPGPVAHFKLDEGAGSAAADSSGYGHSGAVVNGLWAPGKFGGGLKLDGSGDYLEVGDF